MIIIWLHIHMYMDHTQATITYEVVKSYWYDCSGTI